MPLYVVNAAPLSAEEIRREKWSQFLSFAIPAAAILLLMLYVHVQESRVPTRPEPKTKQVYQEPKWETWRDAKGPIPSGPVPYR